MAPQVRLVQGKMLEEMCYDLQAGWGMSIKHYNHTVVNPIYGTGQGSVASPIIWVVMLNMLMQCQNNKGHGAQYFKPNGTLATKINVLGFVDDGLGQVRDNKSTEESMLKLLKRMTEDVKL